MLELHPSTSPSSTHEARACHSSACARAVRQEVAVALEGQDVVVEVASQPRSVEPLNATLRLHLYGLVSRRFHRKCPNVFSENLWCPFLIFPWTSSIDFNWPPSDVMFVGLVACSVANLVMGRNGNEPRVTCRTKIGGLAVQNLDPTHLNGPQKWLKMKIAREVWSGKQVPFATCGL